MFDVAGGVRCREDVAQRRGYSESVERSPFDPFDCAQDKNTRYSTVIDRRYRSQLSTLADGQTRGGEASLRPDWHQRLAAIVMLYVIHV